MDHNHAHLRPPYKSTIVIITSPTMITKIIWLITLLLLFDQLTNHRKASLELNHCHPMGGLGSLTIPTPLTPSTNHPHHPTGLEAEQHGPEGRDRRGDREPDVHRRPEVRRRFTVPTHDLVHPAHHSHLGLHALAVPRPLGARRGPVHDAHDTCQRLHCHQDQAAPGM